MRFTEVVQSTSRVTVRATRKTRHQLAERQKVVDVKRTTAGGDLDERINRRHIRSRRRHRPHDAARVAIMHPPPPPTQAAGNERELLTRQRLERIRDPNGSLLSVANTSS
jgi:hypothetical protein